MFDLLRSTARSLRAHALRFSLTSLGVVWGAFMLTFLSGMMAGVEEHFRAELEEVGPKVIYMGPGSILKNRVGERGARVVEFENEDVGSLVSLDSVEEASPNLIMWSQIVRAGRRTKLLHTLGASEQSQNIRNFEVREGRFLSKLDVDRRARVAYLGARAAERLFGREPVLNRTIQINDVTFRVIGIGVAKGDQLVNTGMPDDLMIVIPYTTAQRWFTQTDKLEEIMFAPRIRELGWQSIRQARQIMGLHHDFDPDIQTALWTFNFYEILKTVYGLLFALRFFLAAAGVVTLLVGAVSIMNIMLVVVGERVQEIGLRKAVGASSRAIFLQFVAEAGAVCGISGLVGAGLGTLLTQAVERLAPGGSTLGSPPVLDPVNVAIITISLAAVGMVAGVAPALRASRIPPAQALRAL